MNNKLIKQMKKYDIGYGNLIYNKIFQYSTSIQKSLIFNIKVYVFYSIFILKTIIFLWI
jgi:hypothetical protein